VSVVEVVPAVRLHPLAGGPAWVAGVFGYRGAVTPVIDLHRLVTGDPCPAKLHARIVVVGNPRLGLLVEKVGGLKELAAAAGYAPGTPGDRPDLGPLVADADGVVRRLDLARLVPLAYREAVA
jgi:chemotaxis-related protein WspB